jgi:hypothetical protein
MRLVAFVERCLAREAVVSRGNRLRDLRIDFCALSRCITVYAIERKPVESIASPHPLLTTASPARQRCRGRLRVLRGGRGAGLFFLFLSRPDLYLLASG